MMQWRDEDTPFGRKTYFGEVELLHPDVPRDPTGITLLRNEEMRYGVQLLRGEWSTFFSAQETLIIAEFGQHHLAWLTWGRAQNRGDLLSPNPSRYVARPGERDDDDLTAYSLFSPLCSFHPDQPNDPTGIILVGNDAGRYGTCVVGSIVFPPTFYTAEDTIKIIEFVAKNHSWLEWGANRNAEQSVNAVTSNEYVSLQYAASADTESEAGVLDKTAITILLFNYDEYANYGIPTSEQEQTGAFRWKPYPHRYWEQTASSRQKQDK